MLKTVQHVCIAAWLGSLLAIVCLFGVPIRSGTQDRVTTGALLQVTPATVDAGRVAFHSTAAREVSLANVTGHSLVIERVETTCGCTTASDVPELIHPRETVSVAIEVRNGLASNNGRFRHFVYIACRNSETGQSELVVVPVVGTYDANNARGDGVQ